MDGRAGRQYHQAMRFLLCLLAFGTIDAPAPETRLVEIVEEEEADASRPSRARAPRPAAVVNAALDAHRHRARRRPWETEPVAIALPGDSSAPPPLRAPPGV